MFPPFLTSWTRQRSRPIALTLLTAVALLPACIYVNTMGRKARVHDEPASCACAESVDTHTHPDRPPVVTADATPATQDKTFTMTPIGVVSNPKGGPVELRIDAAYEPGLKGLEEWSHVQVFYWFDKNDTPFQRRILQVNPRGNRNNPLTGVFACRAPVRPNLIALSTARILSVKGPVVTIDRIDAFDGTPLIDLKPYTPGADRASGGKFRVPSWTRRK